MANDSIMEYGERFRRRITDDELRQNYLHYQKMLREESRRIQDSTSCRSYINRKLADEEPADPWDLLYVACRCIYDLTGDKEFWNRVGSKIMRNMEAMTDETLDKDSG
ncbi:MAG: hypothetical protein IKU36_06275 [Bacteroidales bacterium]|nr:hypothetical protein [Bacteroidales bacterium]